MQRLCHRRQSLILITVPGPLRLPNQQKMAYFVNSA